MPRPPSSAEGLVTVTLKNGATHKLLHGAKTYTFLNGVPQAVPPAVAERLKEKAVDNVTVTRGNKASGELAQKFEFGGKSSKPATKTAKPAAPNADDGDGSGDEE